MSQASFRFSTGIFASLPHSVSQYSAPNDAAQSDVGLNGGQYDDIARLAAQLCDAPIAIVSTIEAGDQVSKASIGIHVTTAPMSGVICRHTVAERDLLVIPDLLADERTATHPLATATPALRFYAGVFLASTDGMPLGTLCVMDREPRPGGLTDTQAAALLALGRQVVAQLDLQRQRTRFAAVFDSAVDYAIVVMDRDGRITDWNEGAVNILGWTRMRSSAATWKHSSRLRTGLPASPTRKWRTRERLVAASTNAGICARTANASGRVVR